MKSGDSLSFQTLFAFSKHFVWVLGQIKEVLWIIMFIFFVSVVLIFELIPSPTSWLFLSDFECPFVSLGVSFSLSCCFDC